MTKPMTRTGDFWAGVGFLLIGAVEFWDAQEVFVPPVLSDMLGPRAFPEGLSAGLFILGALAIARTAIRGGTEADPGPMRVLLLSSAAMIAYVLVFERLGYIISTAFFLGVLFFYLGERRHWLSALVAVGSTLILYLGFGVALHVQLPAGPLGF